MSAAKAPGAALAVRAWAAAAVATDRVVSTRAELRAAHRVANMDAYTGNSRLNTFTLTSLPQLLTQNLFRRKTLRARTLSTMSFTLLLDMKLFLSG